MELVELIDETGNPGIKGNKYLGYRDNNNYILTHIATSSHPVQLTSSFIVKSEQVLLLKDVGSDVLSMNTKNNTTKVRAPHNPFNLRKDVYNTFCDDCVGLKQYCGELHNEL